MKAPCSALGTLPHLSEFSAHTYPLQLQADTVLSLWAGRSVEGQPDGCLHSSLLAPIRSFALGISCPGHQPPLSFECSCFHFQQVFLSVLDCGFSLPLYSQCFLAFQGFLVSSPWRLFLLIWQNSCEFLFFFFSFLSFFFFFFILWIWDRREKLQLDQFAAPIQPFPPLFYTTKSCHLPGHLSLHFKNNSVGS